MDLSQLGHRAKDFAKSLEKAGEEGARLGTQWWTLNYWLAELRSNQDFEC